MAGSDWKAANAVHLIVAGLAMLALAFVCTGCLGPKTGAISVNNVFDEMLACDVAGFAKATDAVYESEWRKLDDGLELKTEEEGRHIRYYLGRYYDDDSVPYKLVFSKTVYVPVSDGGVLAVKEDEVYSCKTGALREGDTTYQRSDPRDRVDLANPTRTEYPYVRLSAEEAQAELEGAGMDELVDRLMASPSDYYVGLYLGCMDSSYGPEDRRGQAGAQG